MARLIEKNLDQNYFNVISGQMYYLLGAFYSSYRPIDGTRGTFHNRWHSLAEIVNRELKSDYTIISDPRPDKSSHRLEMFWSILPAFRLGASQSD